GREYVDPHVRLARDLRLRGLEVRRGTGDEHHVTTFLRHGVGGGAADALGGTGDEGRLAGELEVHRCFRGVWWRGGAAALRPAAGGRERGCSEPRAPGGEAGKMAWE